MDTMLRFCEPIPGWMDRNELDWLYTQAIHFKKPALWADVGVWYGRSFFAVACGLPPGSWLFAVDHFKGTPCERPTLHHVADHPNRPVLGYFIQNLQRFFAEVRADINVSILMSESAEAGKLAAPISPLDAVFIDGDHEGNMVALDIRVWRSNLKPNGLLCGHDLTVPKYPEIKAALDKIGIKYDNPAGSIWRRIVT
jgi:hypothetical protein